MSEPIELFSVEGGKFHKPANPVIQGRPWTPTLAACGRTLTPLNYFVTAEDADRYTGGRLNQKMCLHCKAAEGGTR